MMANQEKQGFDDDVRAWQAAAAASAAEDRAHPASGET